MRHVNLTDRTLRAAGLGLLGLAFPACLNYAVTTAPNTTGNSTDAVATLFTALEEDTTRLRVFLREMPKGGDLHNHLSGTPYAEEFIDWADARNFCVDTVALKLVPPPCDFPEAEAARDLMTRNPPLYQHLVEAMSVRALISGEETGEDGHTQFFNSFDRFLSIVSIEPGKALASSWRAAADDHVLYQELMYNPNPINAHSLTYATHSDLGDFAPAFAAQQTRLPALVAAARAETDRAEAAARRALKCDTDTPDPACAVTVSYNCYGLRLIPLPQLFEQLGLCFALIDADPRFVGVSLVQPEDDPIAVKYYDKHMHMVGFFAEQYPAAKVSLHAGELTLGLVPGTALRDHIRKAIDIAGSDRIGHGVDIAFEHDALGLLDRMAKDEIVVEVNLSSNAVILGVIGNEHPLNLYRKAGVPIVLSTDDLGVLRSDMTEQYVIAARDHGLDYHALKTASRNSAHYAFLPGESLWQDATYTVPVNACTDYQSKSCLAFIANHPKAALEWDLERDFATFEVDILSWIPF